MIKEGQVTDKEVAYVITDKENNLLGVDENGKDAFVSGCDPFAANVVKFESNKDARKFLKSLRNTGVKDCKLWRVCHIFKHKMVELKKY